MSALISPFLALLLAIIYERISVSNLFKPKRSRPTRPSLISCRISLHPLSKLVETSNFSTSVKMFEMGHLGNCLVFHSLAASQIQHC